MLTQSILFTLRSGEEIESSSSSSIHNGKGASILAGIEQLNPVVADKTTLLADSRLYSPPLNLDLLTADEYYPTHREVPIIL